jgi:transposase
MGLPGVGRLTAMTLLAEIGDIARFPTARKLRTWAGLNPQVRNSDRKVRHGQSPRWDVGRPPHSRSQLAGRQSGLGASEASMADVLQELEEVPWPS